MPADPDDVVALIIASALTLVIFNVAGALLLWALWRAERRARAREPDTPSRREPLAPLFYVLSFLFWPASLALCVVFLQKPASARVGAICGTMGVAQVMALAWIVCVLFALFARDIVPWLP